MALGDDAHTGNPDSLRDQRAAIYPQIFHHSPSLNAPAIYLRDPATARLAEFFEAKGLAALKREDRAEQWYGDWLTYQAQHTLYADLLTPKEYAPQGSGFDLLRYTRFLEVFAYFSPAHGYSLQVTFLGLFSILMGSNKSLKCEAIDAIKAGKLLAFGVSEKSHGSDMLSNQFTLAETTPGQFLANGSKYYIGNANHAAIISILARKTKAEPSPAKNRTRDPFAFFALRPAASSGFHPLRKIPTLGVRAADVGEFEVRNHALPESDLFAQNRNAWDVLFGTVTLGKFFLGFASVGICEHAFAEAAAHLRQRLLYGKPAIDMPHLRSMMVQAYARLTAMKLYAYRALDYLHAAHDGDRRYLLYCAVQKAKVSTEGVKVMALLSQCIGARGFEADTYFEMALRDIQLIPGLEGSMHINLAMTSQFTAHYFSRSTDFPPFPPSLFAGEIPSVENPYLATARTGTLHTIHFAPFLEAYRPLASISNVRGFARQAKAFELFTRHNPTQRTDKSDTEMPLARGHCLAIIAYAQLAAENASRLQLPASIISPLFGCFIEDLHQAALALATLPQINSLDRHHLQRRLIIPKTSVGDLDSIASRFTTPQTSAPSS